MPLRRPPSRWWFAAASAVLVALVAPALAQPSFPLPERPNPPRLVNDFVGVLSPTERSALERKLVAIDDSTSTQIAVVVIPTTDGVELNEYTTALGRAWGVGQAGRNNGIVLLVATEDRDVYIATGYGAEGGLTDGQAGRIIRQVIVPAFRNGQFYGGIDGATDAIEAALRGEFDAMPESVGAGDDALGSALCFIFVIFLVLLVMSARRSGGGGSSGGSGKRRRRGPGVIFIPTGGSTWGGGFGGGGGGGFGGGGFGGFGGGSFGGGGAGGSW